MHFKLPTHSQLIHKKIASSFLTSFTRRVCSKPNETSIHQAEVDKFGTLSRYFWDTQGPFEPLHHLNALRVPFARDGVLDLKQVPLEARAGPHPLKGFKFIDVGCGAGLYSEPLARIGADVTGIDASPDLISVAQKHTSLDGSLGKNLRYLNTTVEEYSQEHSNQYDALVCSEVIEHVNNPGLFVENCVRLVKPDGSLFFTTFNKNWLSWFCMIFLAENVGLVPKGTHQYEMLVTPEDLEKMLITNSCSVRKVHGLLYLPKYDWIWIPFTTFSYAVHAIKNKC